MNLTKLISEKRREKERKAKKAKATALTVGVAAGTCIGALSGILFAPKSGKETREDLVNAASDINEKVKTKTKEVSYCAKNNINEAKSKIQEYLANKKSPIVSEAIEETASLDESTIDNKDIEVETKKVEEA